VSHWQSIGRVEGAYRVGDDRGIGGGGALLCSPELPPRLLLDDGLVLELGGARVAVELDVLLEGRILVHALEGRQRHNRLGAGRDRGIALDVVALTASHGERMLEGRAISFNCRQLSEGSDAGGVSTRGHSALHGLGGQRKRRQSESVGAGGLDALSEAAALGRRRVGSPARARAHQQILKATYSDLSATAPFSAIATVAPKRRQAQSAALACAWVLCAEAAKLPQSIQAGYRASSAQRPCNALVAPAACIASAAASGCQTRPLKNRASPIAHASCRLPVAARLAARLAAVRWGRQEPRAARRAE
jgi:hypothetical protein